MTPKQLGAVAHLLPPGTVEAVGIAASLPRNNQGRKRQEALVAKMLRGQLSEQQLTKLEAAVAMAEQNSGLYEDGDVAALVAAWREGLLAGDEAVVAEVYGYPREWAPDHQQLRNLVRQCQQAMSEEAQGSQETQANGALPGPMLAVSTGLLGDGGSSSSSEGEGEGGDPPGGTSSRGEARDEEDDAELAEALAEARLRSGAAPAAVAGEGGGVGLAVARRRRKAAAEPRSRGLLRSLSRTLRALAQRVVQEGLGT